MENGDLLTALNDVFLTYGLLLLLTVAVLGAIAILWLYRQQSQSHRRLQKELQALRFEMDDQRIHPARAPGRDQDQPAAATGQRPLHRMHAELELQAYQKIWTNLRDLHDKLGNFLRAIETGEGISDTRLAARTAALKAKDAAQRLRPFYPEGIEAIVFQLIDNEVHMHLSACAYLDRNKSADADPSGDLQQSAYRSLRDESKLIYEGECRQQLNLLVEAIRQRLGGQMIVD